MSPKITFRKPECLSEVSLRLYPFGMKKQPHEITVLCGELRIIRVDVKLAPAGRDAMRDNFRIAHLNITLKYIMRNQRVKN